MCLNVTSCSGQKEHGPFCTACLEKYFAECEIKICPMSACMVQYSAGPTSQPVKMWQCRICNEHAMPPVESKPPCGPRFLSQCVTSTTPFILDSSCVRPLSILYSSSIPPRILLCPSSIPPPFIHYSSLFVLCSSFIDSPSNPHMTVNVTVNVCHQVFVFIGLEAGVDKVGWYCHTECLHEWFVEGRRNAFAVFSPHFDPVLAGGLALVSSSCFFIL